MATLNRKTNNHLNFIKKYSIMFNFYEVFNLRSNAGK